MSQLVKFLGCKGRVVVVVLAMAVLAVLQTKAAMGRAHLIAVVPIRSTAALQVQARGATRDIVQRLAQLPGYDAIALSPSGKREVDAAAAMGAEVYVVGQVLQAGADLDLALASYDVASDHRIGELRVRLVAAQMPRVLDVSVLVSPTGSAVVASSPSELTSRDMRYMLVPFGQPGNKDTALDFATTEFAKKMGANGKTVLVSEPIEAAEAAASVGTICKRSGVDGVFIGSARHEQRLNYLLGSYPTHGEIRVTLFDCAGSPVWRGYGTGDIVYYWSNAGAAISDVLGKALDIVVTQFMNRASTAKPTASPSPAP